MLKDRVNVLLSRRKDYAPEGAIVVDSIDSLLQEIKNYESDSVFVIGGATVYEQLLPYCDTAYITKFEKEFESDAFFPNLDKSEEWELTEYGEEQTTNPETDTEPEMTFRFCTYKRK